MVDRRPLRFRNSTRSLREACRLVSMKPMKHRWALPTPSSIPLPLRSTMRRSNILIVLPTRAPSKSLQLSRT